MSSVRRPCIVEADRVEKPPTEWGGQFWPQPALAGFPCCPARPGDIQAPPLFHEILRAAGPLQQTTQGDGLSHFAYRKFSTITRLVWLWSTRGYRMVLPSGETEKVDDPPEFESLM